MLEVVYSLWCFTVSGKLSILSASGLLLGATCYLFCSWRGAPAQLYASGSNSVPHHKRALSLCGRESFVIVDERQRNVSSTICIEQKKNLNYKRARCIVLMATALPLVVYVGTTCGPYSFKKCCCIGLEIVRLHSYIRCWKCWSSTAVVAVEAEALTPVQEPRRRFSSLHTSVQHTRAETPKEVKVPENQIQLRRTIADQQILKHHKS